MYVTVANAIHVLHQFIGNVSTGIFSYYPNATSQLL